MSGYEMALLIVLMMVMVFVLPYYVRSIYYVEQGYMGGWLMVQRFYVFGFSWEKSWFVDVPNAAWVDGKTHKPVSVAKEEWLNRHVMAWQDAALSHSKAK